MIDIAEFASVQGDRPVVFVIGKAPYTQGMLRDRYALAKLTLALVLGAIAQGAVDVDYTEQNLSFSQYPLSAATTCSKLTDAFERAWGIL